MPLKLGHFLLGLSVVFWCASSAPVQARSQEVPQKQVPAAIAYPDSPEGLQKQLEDILFAYRTGDTKRAQQLVSNFCLADPVRAWARVFGSDLPKTLGEGYARECTNFASLLGSSLERWSRAKNVEIHTRILVPTLPAYPPQAAQPKPKANDTLKTCVWELRATNKEPLSSAALFAYLDGRFWFFGSLPPPFSGTPERIRVGSSVMAAELLHTVPPTYPPEARSARIQGTVRLLAVIGKDGTIHDLTVMEGHPLLTKAALAAVRQWRYKPTLLAGKQVEVQTTIDVNFVLAQ